MIFESNPRFIFHDSRGFEAGGARELKLVQKFIKQRSGARKVMEQLHAIWCGCTCIYKEKFCWYPWKKMGQVLHSNKWWPTNHCSGKEVLWRMWDRAWYVSSHQHVDVKDDSVKCQWLFCGPRLTLLTLLKSSNSWRKVKASLRQCDKPPKRPGPILKRILINTLIILSIHQRHLLYFEVCVTLILT